MPPVDQDFANASPEEKAAYLSSVDPEFKNASPEEQQAYIQHLSQAQGDQASETTAPPATDTRSFLEKAAIQPSQFSHANPLRYFDELGQGMAQGAEAMLHPLDTARNTYKFLTTPPTPMKDDPEYDKPMLQQLGDMGDTVAQGWGQAATMAPVAKGAGRVISELAPQEPGQSGLPTIKTPNDPAKVLNQAWSGERTGLPYQPNPRFTPRPEPAAPIPSRSGLMLSGKVEPALGTPENPGIHSKIPLRVPRSVLAEESAKTDTSPSRLSPIGARRGRMGPPLRPNVFSSEEAAKIYDAQISRLGAEAKDAGLYSAARGAVKRIPDYQERIGRTLSPYGGEPTEPVDLQDTDLLPRKKTSGQ